MSEDLPKRVKVGARVYQIEVWPTREAGRSTRFGETDHALTTIKIDPFWGRVRTATTLLHEIFHTIWEAWALSEEDKVERTITAFEEGLSAVWRDNPEVMDWIGRRLVGESE